MKHRFQIALISIMFSLLACAPSTSNAGIEYSPNTQKVQAQEPQAQMTKAEVRYAPISGNHGIKGSAAIFTLPSGEHEIFVRLEGFTANSGVYANHIHHNAAGDANCAAQNGDRIIGLANLEPNSSGIALAYTKLPASIQMPLGRTYLNVHSNNPDPVGPSITCGNISLANSVSHAKIGSSEGIAGNTTVIQTPQGFSVVTRLSGMHPNSGIYANHIHHNAAGDANCNAQNGDQIIGLANIEPDVSGMAWAFSSLPASVSYPIGRTYHNIHSNNPDPVGPSIACGDVN